MSPELTNIATTLQQLVAQVNCLAERVSALLQQLVAQQEAIDKLLSRVHCLESYVAHQQG